MKIRNVSRLRTWANRAIIAVALLAILQYLETPHLELWNTCVGTSLSGMSTFDGDYFLLLLRGFLVPANIAIQSLARLSYTDIAQDLCKPLPLIVMASVVWLSVIRLTAILVAYAIRTVRPAPLDAISKNHYSMRPSISVVFSRRLPISTLKNGYRSQGFIGPVARLRASFALRLFFSCYPTASLEAKLSRVFFCERLLSHDKPVGGLARAERREVYVSLSNKKLLMDVVKTLHHEFAHLCAKTPNFERDFKKHEWMRMHENQQSFYPFEGNGGGRAANQQGFSGSKPTTQLLRLGYLHQYGSSCFEEDFCSYVDHMFAKPDQLVSFQDSPLVHAKTKMVYDYYVLLGAKIPNVIHDLWR